MSTQNTEEPEYTKGEWSHGKCEGSEFPSYGKEWPHVMIHVGKWQSRGNAIARVVLGGEGATSMSARAIESNARLIVAAVNAFISAGEKLGINPVILAERLEKGGIAELVFSLDKVNPDWIPSPDSHSGKACCEITNGDVINVQSALSLVRGQSHE